MDDLSYFQSLRANKQADDNTLYLLGKLCKERGLYTEALAVFGELMLKQNETLNDMVLRELSEISTLRKSGESSQQSEAASEATEDVDYEVSETPALRIIEGSSSEPRPARIHRRSEISFKDVGGLDDLKKTIDMKIIKPFQSPELFAKFRHRSGGGILLYGPPGCGKTFIAKATAGQCNAHFRSVKITDILGPYIGESEQNMRNVFETARAHKPCVLFFDEIDTLGFNRLKSSSVHARGVVDQLLTEIEGIDSNTDKMLLIGATNMPWDVDEALRRPGRFDRSVFVPPPDRDAREAIFKLKMEGRPVEELNYRLLADKSPMFSGADIEHVVELAAERVLEDVLRTGNQNLKITQRIIIAILSEEKPSTTGWLKTVGDYVKYSNQTGFYNDVEKYLCVHKMLR